MLNLLFHPADWAAGEMRFGFPALCIRQPVDVTIVKYQCEILTVH
jgi:hypothetical protein